MPSNAKDSDPTFEELKKEMDEFFADFQKKLKALKIDPKVAEETRKSLMPTQKQLLEWAKKNSKNQPVPIDKLQPVANKACKGIPWIHVKAAPGGHPEIPDGVKFSVGSKKISGGFKLKYDSKKGKVKLEPAAAIKFKF